MHSDDLSSSGFVPDVIQILEKYQLFEHIKVFINARSFPSKSQWKFIIHSAIKLHEERKLSVSLTNPRLKRFAYVYGVSLNVHPMWLMEHNAKGYRQHFRNFIKLNGVLCDVNTQQDCLYCNKIFEDHLDHYFHSCDKYQDSREYFWSLVMNTCSVEFSVYLYNLPDPEMTCIILGRRPNDITFNDNEYFHFLTLCSKIWHVLAYEPELTYY